MRCHLVAPINTMSTCGWSALSRINISYKVPPFHHNVYLTLDTLLIDVNLMELGCVFLKTHASTLSLDLSFLQSWFSDFFLAHTICGDVRPWPSISTFQPPCTPQIFWCFSISQQYLNWKFIIHRYWHGHDAFHHSSNFFFSSRFGGCLG